MYSPWLGAVRAILPTGEDNARRRYCPLEGVAAGGWPGAGILVDRRISLYIVRFDMDTQELEIIEQVLPYFKTTDVQRTWKRNGWIPPSELPSQQAKWEYFRRLDTEKGAL
jgi:hypothetical protein